MESVMTDKELEQKANSLIDLFLSFCDDTELDKYIIDDDNLTESGEYLLAAIKKWLKDNVTTEVEWEGEKSRLWTPWTK